MLSYVLSLIAVLYNNILYLVSPPFCTHCHGYLIKRDILCDTCRALLRPVITVLVPVTSKYEVTVFAATSYSGPLRSLVLAKSSSRRVASYQLGHIAWQMTCIDRVPFDCIVPIPLHWMRFASRGYNQAYEMATVIATYSDKKIIKGLKRVRYRPFQAHVLKEQRRDNVKDVFVLSPRYKKELEGKHILLIDDLMTTGETIRAAARELLLACPAKITVLVAARTI